MGVKYTNNSEFMSLKEEFEYFKANHKEFAEKYRGKFIVLHDKEIKGVYESELEAYQEAQKTLELGSFLIQRVDDGESDHSQTFYSRVKV